MHKSVRSWRLSVFLVASWSTACGPMESPALFTGDEGVSVAELTSGTVNVQRALSDLDRACAAADALVADKNDDKRRYALKTRQVGWFWSGLYAGALPDTPVTGEGGAMADALFDAGVKVDMEVISALYTPRVLTPQTPPVAPELALMLTGDALTSMADRLGASTSLHDFACSFVDCAAAMTVTETSELMHILGAIPDADALQEALKTATETRQDRLRGFQKLAAQHRWLEDALVQRTGAAVYHPSLLTNPDPMAIPLELAQLAAVVKRARVWSDNYRRTGLFQPDGLKALYSGIQSNRNEEFKRVVALRKHDLETSVARVEGDIDRLIHTRREAIRGKRDSVAKDAEFRQIASEMRYTRNQLKNVRLRIAQDEAAFAGRVQTFKAELEAAEWDANARGQIGATQHLVISANDARDDRTDALTGHAVMQGGSVWTLATVAGDLLNIHVSGQWSPTCALQQPMSGFAPDDVRGAMTGPEGYQSQASAGRYKIAQYDHSTDHVKTESQDVSNEKAAEGHIGFSLDKIPIFGGMADIGGSLSMRGSDRQSTVTADSERTAQSASSGSESRTGAAFCHGIRSVRVPFPRYPAGSLLLVQTDGREIVQVDVMRTPHNAVLMKGTMATFVVNDIPGCSPPADALQVQVVNMHRLGSDKLAMAMGLVTEFLHERASALRSDPALGATAPALQSEALALMGRSGAPYADLPPALQTLFKAWLDKELLNFERKLAAVSLEHQLESLTMRGKTFAADVEFAKDDARLLTMLPYWSLRNLGVQMLQWKARALTDYVMDNYFPVLELFYPEVVDQLRGERLFQQQLVELLHQPWVAKPLTDGASVGVIRSLVDAVTMIETRIADAEARRHRPVGTRHQIVAVSYHRPGHDVKSPWARGDELDARALWRALEQGGKATITVKPENLYSKDLLTPAVLECDMKLPVVRSMGVVFGVPQWADVATLNTHHLPLTPRVGPNLVFTQEASGELLDLSAADADWHKPRLRRLFSASALAAQVFEQHAAASRAGDGLSPFTTYQFEFPRRNTQQCGAWAECAAETIMDAADEMIFFFEVETRATVGKMTWVETCI